MTASSQTPAPDRMVTPNGVVWTRREIDSSGEGRYAPQGVTPRHRLTMETGSRLLGEHGARPLPASDASLSVRVGTGPVPRVALLRVDAVQRRTLHDMARVWHETGGEDDISTALTVLADTLHADVYERELTAATVAVSDSAGLSDADVALTLEDAVRLRGELDAVIGQLSAASPARRVGSVERAA